MDDPYGVVRYVSVRSLNTLPNFGEFSVDFLAPAQARTKSVHTAVDHWHEVTKLPPSRVGQSVLIAADGKVAEPAIQWLLKHRNNRPVTIKE
jgi:hypothetical protein